MVICFGKIKQNKNKIFYKLYEQGFYKIVKILMLILLKLMHITVMTINKIKISKKTFSECTR